MSPDRRRSSSKTLKSNVRKVSVQNDSARTHAPITPQMIRGAVRKLQMIRAYVESKLIGKYLRRCYPVANDPKAFKDELQRKLECAVSVGLIVKHEEDKYCLPTLRQESGARQSAINKFWEIYKKGNRPLNARRKNLRR